MATISNVSSKYKDIISKSVLLRSGSPAVYQLGTKKENFGTLTRKTVGERNVNNINKTILLVGDTGAGKSALINALVNFTMGVKWEEEVWFKIVDEEERSQTSDVIVYEVFGFEGKTLPHSLTIIDTPGFGDTRGIEHDKKTIERLLDLFRSKGGVDEVNAVGLVMKASENRLTDRLMYVFDSVMSLFGKNIEKNIVALITHSDGIKPENALQALEAAKIKCARDEENQPLHFLFNNQQNTERTEEDEFGLETAWRITNEGMREFTAFLKDSAPQKLMKAAEVLNNRVRLTACIQNLKERITFIEGKQTRKVLNKYEEEMEKNKNFTVEVNEPYKVTKTLENLNKEMDQLTAEKRRLLEEAYQHVVRLNQIALKAESVSTYIHLDFMIEKMKEKGDTEKVRELEEMKGKMDEGTKAALKYKKGQQSQ